MKKESRHHAQATGARYSGELIGNPPLGYASLRLGALGAASRSDSDTDGTGPQLSAIVRLRTSLVAFISARPVRSIRFGAPGCRPLRTGAR